MQEIMTMKASPEKLLTEFINSDYIKSKLNHIVNGTKQQSLEFSRS